MSLLATVTVLAGRLVEAEKLPVDDDGQITTEHPILPPLKELIPGSIASIIVFAALYKFAGPVVKKSFADRTARIQKQLDDSAAARESAEREAAQIRAAKGDIDAERSRLYAEADAQAEALLADGRVRIDNDVVELEARAEAELASAAGRSGDELRAEIARHAADAMERIVDETIDPSVHQDLIEGFIANVGRGQVPA